MSEIGRTLKCRNLPRYLLSEVVPDAIHALAPPGSAEKNCPCRNQRGWTPTTLTDWWIMQPMGLEVVRGRKVHICIWRASGTNAPIQQTIRSCHELDIWPHLLTCRCVVLQGSAKTLWPVCVNFVPAFAYHLCSSLPAAFTQPGQSLLADPCTGFAYEHVITIGIFWNEHHHVYWFKGNFTAFSNTSHQ